MNIFLTILAFNAIIFIHEFGHFIIAKLCKIKVLEFSMFVGPKLFGFTRGETQYSIRLFPILAYVKLEGEETKSDSEDSFGKKPAWMRAAVIAAGPLFNLLSAAIIFIIVFSLSQYQTTTIYNVSPGSPAQKAGILKGDKIKKYNNSSVLIPYNLLEFMYVEEGKPFTIELKRGTQKVVTKVNPDIIPENRYVIGFKPISSNLDDATISDQPEEGTPVYKAGMKKYDKIIKLNDKTVNNTMEMIQYMNLNKGNPINITILRDGNESVLKGVIPQKTKNPKYYELGMTFASEKNNFFNVIKQSTLFTISTTRSVAYTISWLVQGKVSLKQLTGPVGIVSTMSEAASTGENFFQRLLSLLHMTAFISVAIGATNLVPFPALDGSKLVLIAIEAIRRKPIPIEKEAVITMVGFVILIVIAVITTASDFARLFNFM